MKTCTKCTTEKPISAFHKRSAPRTGTYAQCKDCRNQATKEWKQRNKEKVREYRKNYSSDRTEYNANWYRENKERVRERQRQWERDNKERRNAYSQRRRARIAGATVEPVPSNVKELLKELYGPECLVPGCTETENLHLDHVVPLAKGGRHAMDNLQLLCAHHNTSKQDRYVDYRPYPAFA